MRLDGSGTRSTRVRGYIAWNACLNVSFMPIYENLWALTRRGGDVGNRHGPSGKSRRVRGSGEIVPGGAICDVRGGEGAKSARAVVRDDGDGFELMAEDAAEFGMGGNFFGDSAAFAERRKETVEADASGEKVFALDGDDVMNVMSERFGAASREAGVDDNCLRSYAQHFVCRSLSTADVGKGVKRDYLRLTGALDGVVRHALDYIRA